MRRPCKPELVVGALLVYVPFLLSSPGRVSADSKQYLYLDPGAFLRRTVDLWDPSIGAGTVPHQDLGYLFPVAPFYWLLDRIGLPDWVAQRLWLGTLTFLALAGARWLFQELGVGRLGASAGALVYGFTPYQLAFTARISVLLMPWAALPWLVALTMRATRGQGWRAPAALGGVLLLAGGINASSLLLVALAPLLWVGMELWRGPRGRVLAASGRVGAIAVGISIWWLVGVRLQGRYGLPVLQLTENVRTVAERSLPGDVLRGLGNWFFYGRDPSGFSLDQAAAYDRDGLVVALTYAVPVVGLVAALVLRWAHRTYFCLLVLLGTVVSVGAWPFEDPSPYGRVWTSFTSDTSLGLAFRNSPRAVPLVVLGFAGLLAAAVGALPRTPWRRVGAGLVAVLALGALLPVWQQGYLSDGVDRPEDIPDHWLAAVADLDGGDHGTRILELPGSTFAAYRWGDLIDPLTPGLTSRPYVAREVLPYGTPPSVNLLTALDRRAQLGVLPPTAVAPVARLLGVGTVSLRADLEQSARAFSPPPGPVWDALRQAPGLGAPRRYGPPGGDGTDPALASVALFDVQDPEPIVRTAPATGPTVLAGDGDGIVDAATAGILDGHELLLESSALDDAGLGAALDQGAHLVLTDSNRRRIQTWFYTLRDDRGHTERAGETAADPTGYDFRLDPFPGSTDADRTVVEQVGGRVEVTADGGPERPEDRGAHALDGDPVTAWRVGGADPRGAAITVLPDPVPTVGEIRLLQPTSARDGRRVRTVRVTVGDGPSMDVTLGPSSIEAPGQAVSIPVQPVDRLRIEILDVEGGTAADPSTPVGLAEIGVGSTGVDEAVRLPVDLLDRVGGGAASVPLDVVLTRLRLDLPGTDRLDDESHLDRRFELPVGRTFTLSGTARPATDRSPAGASSLPCRDDLLTLDGEPLPVRLGVGGGAGAAISVAACALVELGPGSHRLVAALGRRTGWDLDQLVLSSTAPGPAAGAAPAPDQVETSPDSVRAEVTSDGAPFWFVLGQSASDGWVASATGATVGERTVVDGYANGWLVTPEGPGTVTIHLRWPPQRLVWVGLAISGLAALACLVLLVRLRHRAAPDLRARPQLVAPWRAPSSSGGRVLVGAAVVGAGGLLVATPVVAALGSALTVAAGARHRGRALLLVVAPTALAASRLLTDRPSLAWVALSALAADLVLSRRPSSPAPPPP